MTFATLLSRMKLAPQDAEVIFDRDEPVGRATDLVMPARRWFRRKKAADQSGSATSAGERLKSIS